MLRHAIITNITPLPEDISREAAVAQLHDHAAMIELNPLVIRHVTTDPPANASQDEAENATWYEITDRINYLPGGAAKGEVSYKACFYDLPRGLQTHVFAPAGVDIRSMWSVGGTLPGEPKQPVELGVDVPREGLYIREDVDLRCNMLMIGFVKRNLKKSHHVVAEKIVQEASQKQSTGAYPLERPASATRSIDNETASNSYRRIYAQPVRPMQTHTSFPRRCACENAQHHPRCPYFQPDSPVGPSFQRANTFSTSAVSPISSPFTLASITPLSPITYPELYGSPAVDQCLCTGALHAEGCPSYPGLRIPGLASDPGSPNSIQHTPASLYASLDASAQDGQQLAYGGMSSTLRDRGQVNSNGLLYVPSPEWTQADDLPNALRPMGTRQFVHEME